jgi:hypothetical protein
VGESAGPSKPEPQQSVLSKQAALNGCVKNTDL